MLVALDVPHSTPRKNTILAGAGAKAEAVQLCHIRDCPASDWILQRSEALGAQVPRGYLRTFWMMRWTQEHSSDKRSLVAWDDSVLDVEEQIRQALTLTHCDSLSDEDMDADLLVAIKFEINHSVEEIGNRRGAIMKAD